MIFFSQCISHYIIFIYIILRVSYIYKYIKNKRGKICHLASLLAEVDDKLTMLTVKRERYRILEMPDALGNLPMWLARI